jgi:hypothetical protein
MRELTEDTMVWSRTPEDGRSDRINAGARRPEENEDDRVIDCEHLETCLSTRRKSMASNRGRHARVDSGAEAAAGYRLGSLRVVLQHR